MKDDQSESNNSLNPKAEARRARQERLAVELRANLRRRKTGAAGRSAMPMSDSEPPEDAGENG